MKLKSDGLGKTELEAGIEKVKKVDDLVVFFAKTSKPVKWHLRMGFQEEEFRALVWHLFRPANALFVLKAFWLSIYEYFPFHANRGLGAEVRDNREES